MASQQSEDHCIPRQDASDSQAPDHPRSKRSQTRKYVRKVKGCHECSQRRINCDRANPQCQKCLAKGLRCSGLGIRYRFNHGFASRGNMVGKSVPQVNDKQFHVQFTKQIRQSSMHGNSSIENKLENHYSPTFPSSSFKKNVHVETCRPKTSGNESFSSLRDYPALAPPDSIPVLQRRLILHFSEAIAKEMVAIDGSHNGWRCLVLPIAHLDDTVMNAVLAASGFHLLLNAHAPSSIRPDLFYTRAILGLRQRQHLQDYDSTARCFVLLTISVLLVAVMVNAGPDFPILFRLLESGLGAIEGQAGLGEGELPEFLTRQINKLRVYAAPLLNEQAGVDTITSHAPQSFDCLRYTGSFHPEYSVAVSFIADINQQAYDIYLRSVSTISSPNTLAGLIEKFKSTWAAFPPNSPGQHVLVWAPFIAAAVSFTAEDREFFRMVFMKHHQRSGFGNLVQALIFLETIWASGQAERWTVLFRKTPIFIM